MYQEKRDNCFNQDVCFNQKDQHENITSFPLPTVIFARPEFTITAIEIYCTYKSQHT